MAITGLNRFAGSVAMVLLMGGAHAEAQIDTATIVGTVVDQSGAVLPGVTVTATQNAPGVSVMTTTNESGQNVFPGVKVGVYTVAAELSGFRRAARSDVRVKRAGPRRG